MDLSRKDWEALPDSTPDTGDSGERERGNNEVVTRRELEEQNRALAAALAAQRESDERLRLAADATNDLVWDWDLQTNEVQWNDAVYTRLGYTPEEVECTLNWWYTHIHPEDRERVMQHLHEVIASREGTRWQDEYRYLKANGSPIYIFDRGFVVRDEQGRPVRMIGAMQDLTARKAVELELAERVQVAYLRAEVSELLASDLPLQEVLQRAADAIVGHLHVALVRIWILDERDALLNLWASAGLYTHLDGQHSQVPVGEFKTGRIARLGEPYLTNDLQNEPHIAEPEWTKREGLVAFAGYPLLVEGRIVGILALFSRQPLSQPSIDELKPLSQSIGPFIERRLAERLRRITEQRLRLAIESADIGTWDYDPVSGTLEWDERCKRMFGLRPDAVVSYDTFLVALHPADRARAHEAVERALSSEGDGSYDIEYRTIGLEDGVERWVSARGQAFFDENGRAVRFIGTAIDVTERKRKEQTLRFIVALNATTHRLVDANEIVITTTSRLGEHLAVNRCLYVEVDEDEGTFTVVAGYAEGLSALDGRFPLADFGLVGEPFWREGKPLVVHDVGGSLSAQQWLSTYHNAGCAAFVCVPVRKGERIVAAMIVQQARPRVWSRQEVELLQLVSIRCWESVERARVVQGLRENEERLSIAQRAGRVGVFEWNIPEGVILWTPELEALYGLPPGTFGGTPQAWRELTVREDRLRLMKGLEACVREQRADYACEFRALLPDGSQRWFAGQARFYYGANGVPLRMIGVNIDIDDRKRAEAEREELLAREQAARRQAEEASRLKDEFLATVSHELRTPLTSILGWARLLQSHRVDGARMERGLEIILNSAKGQSQLIEDLLDVSRIVTGKLRLEPRPLMLAPVVEAAVDTVRPAVEAKAIRLHEELDDEVGMVLGDPDRLQQVVWNLLSNAVKFTPDGGEIVVSLSQRRTHARITVRDSGKGISAEFLPYIFDRFRQADGSSTRAFGGLGLGLSIVRHIIELHGGTVEVHSDGEQKGATFTVRLPLMHDNDPGVAQVVPVMERRGDDEDGSLECPPELQGLRVLLVDDEPDTREVLKIMLEQCGAEVRSSASADNVLAHLERWRPDVLVSDIAMPGEDGYSLISRIRALPPELGGSVPALAVTAYVRETDRDRVFAAGFQEYVPKPVEFQELVNGILRII